MNLNVRRQRRSQQPEPEYSPGNRLASDRQVFDVLVKSDETARLDDGNLPAPFETRAGGLNGRIGIILPLPIGTHEENIASHDHYAVMNATLLDFL